MNATGPDRFARTRILLGKEGLERLHGSTVIVFGLGGVGSFAAEALARAGVGSLVLVDSDVVEITNFNRQILATSDNLGVSKVAAMTSRLLSINSDLRISGIEKRVSADNAREFIPCYADYIVDAIDDVPAKVGIIITARQLGIPVVSSMGAGNRLDPTQFRVMDISATHTCPLARAVRQQLRRAGIVSGVKVVFSQEKPLPVNSRVPGSISFVPPVAGMILASVVVRDLCGDAVSPADCDKGGDNSLAGGDENEPV